MNKNSILRYVGKTNYNFTNGKEYKIVAGRGDGFLATTVHSVRIFNLLWVLLLMTITAIYVIVHSPIIGNL